MTRRDPDFLRMTGWPLNMETDTDLPWRSVLRAGAFAIDTVAELQRQSFACLPPETERALRRTQVRPQLVPAPEPVRVPTPSSRTWPWLLGFGVAVLVFLVVKALRGWM